VSLPDAVGVSRDLDDCFVVFLERTGDLVEHRVELRVQVRAVERKRDTTRHIEGNVVALADDIDAGASHLLAQLRFLLVHVIPDGAADQRARGRADYRRLERIAARGQQPHDRAGSRAISRSASCFSLFRIVREGVRRLAAGEYHGHGGHDGHGHSESGHVASPPSESGAPTRPRTHPRAIIPGARNMGKSADTRPVNAVTPNPLTLQCAPRP
jgi:hypothetical protein